MEITTNMIRFFANHIISSLDQSKSYEFDSDYYWNISCSDICMLRAYPIIKKS